MNAPGSPKITTFLPRVRSSILNSLGPTVQPAVSTSTNSDSVPAGSLSPTLIVMRSPWGASAATQHGRGPRIAGLARNFNPYVRRVSAPAACSAGAVAVALPVRTGGGGPWLQPERRPRSSRRAARRCLIATRKGLWTLAGDAARRTWKLAGPHFLGNIVHHAVVDPRDGKTLLAAARTGHLGPTVFRSTDRGRTWKEAAQPPAFKQGSGRTVDHTFWLTPGHATEPGVWYAGTSPQGLFRSADGGRHLGRGRRLQRSPAAQGLVRRRPGRHAGWPEAALGPGRPARREAYVHRDVERRRLRIVRRRLATGSR